MRLEYTGNKIEGLRVTKLVTSSWIGYSPGASHYYGDIYRIGETYQEEDIKIKLHDTLTQRQATKLNKGEFDVARYAPYERGQNYHGFDDMESLRSKAKNEWLLNFPDSNILFEVEELYNRGVLKILSIKGIKDEQVRIEILNSFWHSCDKLHWFCRKNEDIVEELHRGWQYVLSSVLSEVEGIEIKEYKSLSNKGQS